MGRREADATDRSADDAARLPVTRLRVAVADPRERVVRVWWLHDIVVRGARQTERETGRERIAGEDRVAPHRRTSGQWRRGAPPWTSVSGRWAVIDEGKRMRSGVSDGHAELPA